METTEAKPETEQEPKQGKICGVCGRGGKAMVDVCLCGDIIPPKPIQQEPRYQWFKGMLPDHEKFRFRFRHMDSRVTICFLEFSDGVHREGYKFAGHSLCCPLDNFDKEYGRKAALQRAIDNIPLPAPWCLLSNDRRAIWRCYFETRGKKMRHEKKKGQPVAKGEGS